MSQNQTPYVRDYLWLSILAVMLCLPAGIVAVRHSKQVIARTAAGDIDGAKESSARAKKWIDLSVLFSVALSLVFAIIGMLSEQP